MYVFFEKYFNEGYYRVALGNFMSRFNETCNKCVIS